MLKVLITFKEVAGYKINQSINNLHQKKSKQVILKLQRGDHCFPSLMCRLPIETSFQRVQYGKGDKKNFTVEKHDRDYLS